MAHWGVAYASGPFYNFPWGDFSSEEVTTCTQLCHTHMQSALRLQDHITPLEYHLILALSQRFQQPYPVSVAEFALWDDAYADAMRAVYQQFSTDLDVVALFAEAMMARTPWKLWDPVRNVPAQNADTLEIVQVLQQAIRQSNETNSPQHPAILHLHIHALEMSPHPEQALESADTLSTLCPEAGHMNHMPGHIYVLCGQYEKAEQASEKAIAADRLYLEYAGPYNFYTTARCHDLHLMMYTCMLMGKYHAAMAAANEMCETLTPDVFDFKGRPQMSITMEGYYSMYMHVLVRFGKWQEIVDTPLPVDEQMYCVSTVMFHYAKAVAYATLGNFTQADNHRKKFYETYQRVPSNRKFFNNSAHDVLAIGEEMMEGEIAYHKGDFDTAFSHLRTSIERDDHLSYSEPWAWMHPPRHALGALLLEQGHLEEAKEVYQADLGINQALQRCAQHPDNVWSLHGLVECLRKTHSNPDEISFYTEKLNYALTLTDIPVLSSCCCRKNN